MPSKYIMLWGQKVTLDNVDAIVREHYKDAEEKGYILEESIIKDFTIYCGKDGAIELEIAFIKAVIKKYGDEE
jgi:hypothetical protein